MDDFKNVEYLNNLYDIYKNLLTSKQQEYFELYFFEDYSLAEIADEFKVSRNAIHTTLKKSVSKLEDVENKLGFHHKKCQIIKILDKEKIDLKNINQIKEIL